MKKLVIIVPKGSALDSYLIDAGFIYETIVCLRGSIHYKMNISTCFNIIELLVSKFCLKDFQIQCHDGLVTFRVRS